MDVPVHAKLGQMKESRNDSPLNRDPWNFCHSFRFKKNVASFLRTSRVHSTQIAARCAQEATVWKGVSGGRPCPSHRNVTMGCTPGVTAMESTLGRRAGAGRESGTRGVMDGSVCLFLSGLEAKQLGASHLCSPGDQQRGTQGARERMRENLKDVGYTSGPSVASGARRGTLEIAGRGSWLLCRDISQQGREPRALSVFAPEVQAALTGLSIYRALLVRQIHYKHQLLQEHTHAHTGGRRGGSPEG